MHCIIIIIIITSFSLFFAQFFNNGKMYKRQGLAYYEHITKAHLFPRPVVLDASPGYIVSRDALDRIQRTYTDDVHHRLRFVVMLRAPVDRFLSQYRFRRADYFTRHPAANQSRIDPAAVSKYFEGNGDISALANTLLNQYEQLEAASAGLTAQGVWERAYNYSGIGSEDPLWRGMYDQQLDMWFAAFPRSCFCVLSMEHLRSDAASALRRVASFLGLSAFNWSSASPIHAHTSALHSDIVTEFNDATRARLEAFYERQGVEYWRHVERSGYYGCLPHRTARGDD